MRQRIVIKAFTSYNAWNDTDSPGRAADEAHAAAQAYLNEQQIDARQIVSISTSTHAARPYHYCTVTVVYAESEAAQ